MGVGGRGNTQSPNVIRLEDERVGVLEALFVLWSECWV